MATITLQSAHGNTITPHLSAFGPNLTQAYDSLVLNTLQTGVTAFITDFHFLNTPRYTNQDLFTFTPMSLSTLPVAVTSVGIPIGLSASVAECTLGPRTGTLMLTLSSQALSGGTAVPVDTLSQSVNFTLTAVNLPYHHHLCRRRFHQLTNAGIL